MVSSIFDRGIFLTGLVIVVLCAGCASSSSSSREPQRDTRAQELAQVNIRLAAGYLEKGRLELALEKINTALRLDPKSATGHTVAGIIHEQIGQAEMARKSYRRAASLAPDDGNVLNNYGQFLCKNGQIEEAIEKFDKAVSQPFYHTPHVAMTNACACLEMDGRIERAEQYCRKALESNAEYPDTLFRLSRIMHTAGEDFKARAFLQRFESVAQHTPDTLQLCYDIETSLEDQSAAADCAKQLRKQFPKSNQARDLDGEA